MKNMQTKGRKLVVPAYAGMAAVAAVVTVLAACQTQAAVPAASQTQQGQQGTATVIPGNTSNATQVIRQAQDAQSNVTGASAATPTPLPTRAVAPVTTVAVDGELALAMPLTSASFEASGKVTAVHVKPGQKVNKGDVLAELDGTELETALQQAQEQLTLKQAQIASSLAPATKTDINSAKASLSAAYAAYNELKEGSSEHDVEQALRSWNRAKNSLYGSQVSRDKICDLTPGSSTTADFQRAMTDKECKQADLNVQAAELSERTAYQQYLDAQQPATQDELSKAWASVVQAQTSLSSLQNGVSDEQKQVYDIELEQAKVAVERAQRDLAEAKLISPCSCVVQDVTLSPGASADGSITLLGTSQVKFRTTNLSELDVIKLQAGQTATIRLKAFDQTFTGTVGPVLPMSSGSQGSVALFTAFIDLDPTDAALLPGMTGQAEINLK